MMTIKDYTDSIQAATHQRASIFLRIAAENVVDIARPKTPKDKGNLNQDVLKVVNGLKGSIEWRKKYAEYQERGSRKDGTRVVKNYTTPGTGPHYAENAINKIKEKTNIIASQAHLT